MIKPSIVLLSLVGVLTLGFTCGLQADEPKPAATPSHETDVIVVEDAIVEDVETAIDEQREAEAMNIAERAMRFARLKMLVRTPTA